MKRFFLMALGACVMLVLPARLLAQVELDVERPVDIFYLPFQQLPDGEDMMLRVTNQGENRFKGVIEIEPTDATAFQWLCGDPIEAFINDPLVQRNAGRFVIPIDIAAQDEEAFMLRWRPVNRGFAVPGPCELLVNIRLFDDLRQVLEERFEVPITLSVGADSSLAIAGTSGSVNADRTFAFIDFGELETGETAFILFGAKANTDVEFTISSENGGALVSLENDSLRVPYSATFDGSPLALASEQVLSRQVARSLDGSRFRLDVQIGNTDGAFAGTYQDNIIVEMRAQ